MVCISIMQCLMNARYNKVNLDSIECNGGSQ